MKRIPKMISESQDSGKTFYPLTLRVVTQVNGVVSDAETRSFIHSFYMYLRCFSSQYCSICLFSLIMGQGRIRRPQVDHE